MNWLSKIFPSKIRASDESKKASVPEGVWVKCPGCTSVLYSPELARHLQVCPKCQYHFRISARKRIEYFLDPENQIEIAKNLEPKDILKFKDTKKYKDRLHQAQKSTGEKDAMVAMQGLLKGQPIVVCAFEYGFIGGSMGAIVGEKFVQAAMQALQNKIPFICFAASGGARMQEALISLLQMAKTSSALKQLSDAHLPYISVLTDPTMGGVSASLAMLGDIIIAEPRALIGFAGPRVIEQTVRQVLPEGFQSSEFLLEHGHIDKVVDRRELPDFVHRLITKLLHGA